MAIGSWDANGTVYIWKPSRTQVRTQIQSLLKDQEVLGLKIIDDQVYVVQKSELWL